MKKENKLGNMVLNISLAIALGIGGILFYEMVKEKTQQNQARNTSKLEREVKNESKKSITSNPESDRIDKYINAIIEIESHGNPNAERYEAHIKDTSYGLGQILTSTAKERESRNPNLPRLGETQEEIKESLCNPEINRKYTKDIFQREFDFYQDPNLAVAAYNSGHLTPRNARIQEQLNELLSRKLSTDGILGSESKKAVKEFQKQYRLKEDGILGSETYQKIQEVWERENPDKENPRGIIPSNKYTPNHVRKFREALEN